MNDSAMRDPNLTLLAGEAPRRWLVTGAAGFIGSNLVETLLRGGQFVTGLDNFSTGYRRNLEEVRRLVGETAWARFRFMEGDVRDLQTCRDALGEPAAASTGSTGSTGSTEPVDYVLHQAALGSVPRSISEPMPSFASNVEGFLQLLDAARVVGVRRFVYASSSAVYGDHPGLPKIEDQTGGMLSPYAATKAADELFADTWARVYGIECVGLRYFNVFGPRQDPDGAYAAVVPCWVASLLQGEQIWINGDGETSRDFCYVSNAVQANLRAALTPELPAAHQVFNIAVGERTTLNELFKLIRTLLADRDPSMADAAPAYREFRAGDVRHSLADIARARNLLGYAPTHNVGDGLAEAIDWYSAFVEA
ncbi:MAG: SDR family oxidoreductase [Burkholderiaceae bacterium]